MSRSLSNICQNTFNVTGTLSELQISDGMSKANRPYRKCRVIVRVDQSYGGKSEVSEIATDIFAMKTKADGSANKTYEAMGQYSLQFKSIAQVGLDAASRVSLTGRTARIQENMFARRDNPETIISTWQLGSMGIFPARTVEDCATFCMEIFIMKMEREISIDGEETGRLRILGLNTTNRGPNTNTEGQMFTFYVERPETIDYIERNWSENDTVQVVGRIRNCSEEVQYHSTDSWGEDIPQASTRNRHELIITKGSDFPLEEDMAFAPEDIKTLYADRAARREQIVLDAKNAAKVATKAPAAATSSYDWEE